MDKNPNLMCSKIIVSSRYLDQDEIHITFPREVTLEKATSLVTVGESFIWLPGVVIKKEQVHSIRFVTDPELVEFIERVPNGLEGKK